MYVEQVWFVDVVDYDVVICVVLVLFVVFGGVVGGLVDVELIDCQFWQVVFDVQVVIFGFYFVEIGGVVGDCIDVVVSCMGYV